MVLIFIAMLLCIQVRSNYSTYQPHIPRPPPRTRSRPRPLPRTRVRVKPITNTVVYREGSLSLLDYLIWSHRRKRQRLKNALPGFKVKWWRQKVTFRDGGGLSITPRWHIKHKHAIYRVAIGLVLMVITWQLFGTPIGVVGAVITSAGAGNWTNGPSWVGGVAPGIADDAIVAAGHNIQMDAGVQDCNSIQVQATGTLTFPAANNLRTNGVNGAGFCVDIDGFLVHGNGLFTLIDDLANNANMDWVGEGGNPFDILVTYRDRTTNQTTACTADGGIQFSSGTWDSGTAGGNFQLDVVVQTLVTGGTFLGNASTVSTGDLEMSAGTYTSTSTTYTINARDGGTLAAIEFTGGVFNHSNGILNFTYAGTALVEFGGGAGNPYNVIVNHASIVLTLDAVLDVDNDLTITAGEMTTSGTNYALTVAADVSVVGTFTGNASAVSHGSLTITGTYSATSGVTTITAETAGGWAFDNDGTYTHNNGTLTFTLTVHTNCDFVGTGNPYNLIVNTSDKLVNHVGSVTIDNDLTVTAGTFRTSAPGDSTTVTGDADITGGLGGNSQSGAVTLGSLTINSGGDYDATSGTTTITSESGIGRTWDVASGATFTHSNGIVEFTYAGVTLINHNSGVGNFYNIIANHASLDAVWQDSVTADNDVTVTAGTLRGNNGAATTLTVTNNLTVSSGATYSTGTGGGNLTVTGTAQVSGTLTCNASTISIASGATNKNSLYIKTGGTFAGGSGAHTFGGQVNMHEGAATVTLTSGTTTFNARNSSNSNITWSMNGSLTFDDANGTIAFTYAGEQLLYEANNTARTFYNMIVNDASCHLLYFNGKGFAVTCDNDLTITAGEYDLIDKTGGTSRALTVTADADVTGTLTGNASAISLGSLTLQAAGTYDATTGTTTLTGGSGATLIDFLGTFTHNNGLVNVTSLIANGSFLTRGSTPDAFYNLSFAPGSATSYRAPAGSGGWTLLVDNDMTVGANATVTTSNGNSTITVTGDVDVTGTINSNIVGHVDNFGSLTINSGGTYSATSGVTTITSAKVGEALRTNSGSTLTHNNGTITFTSSGGQVIRNKLGSALVVYNLILNKSAGTVNHRDGDITVANDFTITSGTHDTAWSGTSYTLTVTGDTDITGTLTGNASTISLGSLTINSGGTYTATTGTTAITSETAGGFALLVVAGGTLTTSPGTIDFQITSGPTNIQTTTEALFNVLVSGTQAITMTDTTTIAGTLTVEVGATWDTNASDQALTITGTVTIAGILTQNSSVVDLNGDVIISPGGVFTAPDGSGSLNIAGDLDNDGTFTHSDGTVILDGSGKTVNSTGGGEFTFNNCTVSGTVTFAKSQTVEATMLASGTLTLDANALANTLTMGTNAAKGTINVTGTLTFGNNATNAVHIFAADTGFATEVNGSIDWDGGGAATEVTARDLILVDSQTIGTSTVTVTATRVVFAAALTVTTATLEGTGCTIDASTMTVSSGVYIEGWLDPTEASRSGYDWILIGGDYTLSTNKTYTSRRNFYKPGGATLTLDTGTSLTATDPTVDGTFITAEADLLDTNNGTFTVKYTMDFKIVDAIGVAIQSVVITLYDQFDAQLWTQTTDSNGDITAQATITAIYGVGARQNHPQNLTMILTGYQTLNYNFVLNRPMDLTLGLPAAATPATGGDSAYTDTITIYRKTGRDDAAQKTYDGGTSVTCSVQQKRSEIKSPTGKVINSTTTIYVPAATAVDVEDKIVLEDTTTVQVLEVQTVNAYDGSPDHLVIRT